jgi:hypothetical protein
MVPLLHTRKRRTWAVGTVSLKVQLKGTEALIIYIKKWSKRKKNIKESED